MMQNTEKKILLDLRADFVEAQEAARYNFMMGTYKELSDVTYMQGYYRGLSETISVLEKRIDALNKVDPEDE